MAKYEKCGHFIGLCPCLTCSIMGRGCGGCLDTRTDTCAVDTAELCETARQYCESGREDNVKPPLR